MTKKVNSPLIVGLTALVMCACTAKQPLLNTNQTDITDDTPHKPKPTSAIGQAENFTDWTTKFTTAALDKGYAPALVEALVAQMNYRAQVVSLDQNQPEFSQMIWTYLDSALASDRVNKGQQKYQQLQPFLTQLEEQYGVPGQYLIAIWGLESAYGTYTGDMNLPSSLATLAYEGRRAKFAEDQLFALLDLLSDEQVLLPKLEGSWAGGMGHTQFIPTTYRQYGVDGDGDDIRNPWDLQDGLASTANYLSKSGWQSPLPWGQEVVLPQDFEYQLLDTTRPLKDWQTLGISAVSKFPLEHTQAKLWLPGGHEGPAFLLYPNHEVIKVYNNSSSYALAVGLLADAIAGNAPLQQAWPRQAKPLATAQVQQLQTLLNELGYDAGAVDGILGKQTRNAFAQWQSANEQIADGFVSVQSTTALLKD